MSTVLQYTCMQPTGRTQNNVYNPIEAYRLPVNRAILRGDLDEPRDCYSEELFEGEKDESYIVFAI
ncbi:hypothetical protein ACQKWADRAFT_79393 [Trichoderma austrokoningii]